MSKAPQISSPQSHKELCQLLFPLRQPCPQPRRTTAHPQGSHLPPTSAHLPDLPGCLPHPLMPHCGQLPQRGSAGSRHPCVLPGRANSAPLDFNLLKIVSPPTGFVGPRDPPGHGKHLWQNLPHQRAEGARWREGAVGRSRKRGGHSVGVRPQSLSRGRAVWCPSSGAGSVSSSV